MTSEDSAILMHKSWPNPKFPKLCVWPGTLFSSKAGKWQHLPGPTQQLFCGEASMGIRGGAGRRGRFLCCAFVSGGSGITFLRVSARWGAPRFGFSLVGAEQSPWVGAGLSALLCLWGRWRPARAGGNDGKGWDASKCGDSCASLLGAHPRSWAGIRRGCDLCEVSVGQLVAEVWVCRECEIPGMLLSQNKPVFLLKTTMGLSTLPCLRC